MKFLPDRPCPRLFPVGVDMASMGDEDLKLREIQREYLDFLDDDVSFVIFLVFFTDP